MNWCIAYNLMIIDAPYTNTILIGTIYSSTNTSNRMNSVRNKNKNNKNNEILFVLTLEGVYIKYKIIKFIQNGMSIPNGIYYSYGNFSSLCEKNEIYNYYLSKWVNYFENNNVFIIGKSLDTFEVQIDYAMNRQWINNEMIVFIISLILCQFEDTIQAIHLGICLRYYGLINIQNNKQLKDAIVKYLRAENIFYYLYVTDELNGILIDFLCQSNKYLRTLVLGSISNECIKIIFETL